MSGNDPAIRCGVVGDLTVGGRVVGQIRCELDAGHETWQLGEAGGYAWVPSDAPLHRATLEWSTETIVDFDLLDPGETFDVPVELPTREPRSWHDYSGNAGRCLVCGVTRRQGVHVDCA